MRPSLRPWTISDGDGYGSFTETVSLWRNPVYWLRFTYQYYRLAWITRHGTRMLNGRYSTITVASRTGGKITLRNFRSTDEMDGGHTAAESTS